MSRHEKLSTASKNGYATSKIDLLRYLAGLVAWMTMKCSKNILICYSTEDKVVPQFTLWPGVGIDSWRKMIEA